MTWDHLQEQVKILVGEINKHKYKKYEYIYGIPRGGLIPATMMSHILEIPLITTLDWEVMKHRILVVDDIIDSGETIQRYQRIFDTAAVLVKTGLPFTKKPTYYARLVEDDVWTVFPYEVGPEDSISKINIGDR